MSSSWNFPSANCSEHKQKFPSVCYIHFRSKPGLILLTFKLKQNSVYKTNNCGFCISLITRPLTLKFKLTTKNALLRHFVKMVNGIIIFDKNREKKQTYREPRSACTTPIDLEGFWTDMQCIFSSYFMIFYKQLKAGNRSNRVDLKKTPKNTYRAHSLIYQI